MVFYQKEWQISKRFFSGENSKFCRKITEKIAICSKSHVGILLEQLRTKFKKRNSRTDQHSPIIHLRVITKLASEKKLELQIVNIINTS